MKRGKHITNVDRKKIIDFMLAQRVDNQFTQSYLSKLIGTSPSCISKFETNVSMMTDINFKKLCNVLNVNYDSIINQNKLELIDKNKAAKKSIANTVVKNISRIIAKEEIILMLKLEGYKIYKPSTTYTEI